MKAKIEYTKIFGFNGSKRGYQVMIFIEGKTELPFENKIFRTKREARLAVAAAYSGSTWKYNAHKNTIII